MDEQIIARFVGKLRDTPQTDPCLKRVSATLKAYPTFAPVLSKAIADYEGFNPDKPSGWHARLMQQTAIIFRGRENSQIGAHPIQRTISHTPAPKEAKQ